MSKVTIYVSFVYDKDQNDLFFGVAHSKTPLTAARLAFSDKKNITPKKAVFIYELDSNLPNFEKWVELCILRSLEKIAIYFHNLVQGVDNELGETPENILNFSEQEILLALKSINQSGQQNFRKILYWGDCNLGYVGESHFPEFLKNVKSFITQAFPSFSGEIEGILVSGDPSTVNAAKRFFGAPIFWDHLRMIVLKTEDRDLIRSRSPSPERRRPEQTTSIPSLLVEQQKMPAETDPGQENELLVQRELFISDSADEKSGEFIHPEILEEKPNFAEEERERVEATLQQSLPEENIVKTSRCIPSFFKSSKTSSAINIDEMSVAFDSQATSKGSSAASLTNKLLSTLFASKRRGKTAITQMAEEMEFDNDMLSGETRTKPGAKK